MPEIVTSTQEQYARQVASVAYQMGVILAKRGERLATTKVVIQVSMSIIGLFALISTNVPVATSYMGESGIKIVAIISAGSLLIASAVSWVLGTNPPERFKDYSKYILGYHSRINEMLSDDALPKSVKSARLNEVLRLANKNIEDVRSQWSWVEDRINRNAEQTVTPNA